MYLMWIYIPLIGDWVFDAYDGSYHLNVMSMTWHNKSCTILGTHTENLIFNGASLIYDLPKNWEFV